MTASELKELGKKVYRIAGFELITVKCTQANVAVFQELFPKFKSGEDRVSLMKFLLLPSENVNKIDFHNDVEIAEMSEVAEDFLYRSTGTSPAALNSLTESILQNPQIMNSIPGLTDLLKTSDLKTGSAGALQTSTRKRTKR